MCKEAICICIPVSQAPHGWLRVSKAAFFTWVGAQDIVTSIGRSYTEYNFRNQRPAGRRYEDTGDYYLLAVYARTVDHIRDVAA
jgi:hypothetical protein